METTFFGFVGLFGRPNVGKSTLLNRLMGEKISITARKPQTTRQKIWGIQTEGPYQCVYVDTPGMHRAQGRALNRWMMREALRARRDVDLILWMVDVTRGVSEEDTYGLDFLKILEKPVLAVLNQIDRLKSCPERLPQCLERLPELYPFSSVFPISARTGEGVSELKDAMFSLLPEGPHGFPAHMRCDRDLAFRLSECLREKLFRHLGAELPYDTHVQLESMEERPEIFHIHAMIWVAREGQKGIVLGEHGARMKKIATEARLDMEKILKRKVFLKTWVKVRAHWNEDPACLNASGFLE